MVSARLPIYNSPSPLIKPLGIVPSEQITIGITVTLMFHCFFSSLARSRYLSFFVFFYFHSVVHRDGKVHYSADSLFISTIPRFDFLTGILWSVCILKSQTILHYYHFTFLRIFHTSVSWCFFYRSLSDGKFPQVSRTLLTILAYLNNDVVWMLSTCPPISKSFSPFTKSGQFLFVIGFPVPHLLCQFWVMKQQQQQQK